MNCLYCDKEFHKTVWNKRFCSRFCAEQYRYINFKKKDYRKVICGFCGIEFEDKTGRARFCCKQHSKQFHNDKLKKLFSHLCLFCFEEFNTTRSWQVFCSLTCHQKFNKRTENGKIRDLNAKHKRRARLKYSDIDGKWLKELKESTEVCVVCNEKMNVVSIHPRSKSLDHIIPICLDGQHLKCNVRFICLKCNVKKGGKNELQLSHEE